MEQQNTQYSPFLFPRNRHLRFPNNLGRLQNTLHTLRLVNDPHTRRSLVSQVGAGIARTAPIARQAAAPAAAAANLPRLERILRADVVRGARLFGLARRAERAVLEVLEERRQARHARHNDAQVGLDRRPQDERRAVRVHGQSLDRHDADDLDHGDEDAEPKEA